MVQQSRLTATLLSLTRRTTYRRRRRLRFLLLSQSLLTAVFFVLLATLLLPRDSPLRLAVRFNAQRALNGLRGAATDRDAWLRTGAAYPVDLHADVGYLIKTGYGTRHRVPEQLAAFRAGGRGGKGLGDFLVVGDWTTVNATDAEVIGVPVHDAVGRVVETKVGGRVEEYPRLVKHRRLQEELEAGNEEEALRIGREVGWELDALKFIMGMEMLYTKMPHKKWYMILDDDTFLVRPSLLLLLRHLDPSLPHYLGNAVGDYKGRFAHGGSAILLSGPATRRLFLDNPAVVSGAYAESLTETWGDRLVATTLQKVGVYLDEKYSHHFNGEAPGQTRIRGDRFCSPLVSFHGLRGEGDMVGVGRRLAGEEEEPVLWRDVWRLFGGGDEEEEAPRDTLGDAPKTGGKTAVVGPRRSADHVGRPTEETRTWAGVESAGQCRGRCEGAEKRWCLAWTYETATKRCNLSPWMVIGDDDTTSSRGQMKRSGVNWAKVKELNRGC